MVTLTAACGRSSFDDRELSQCFPNCAVDGDTDGNAAGDATGDPTGDPAGDPAADTDGVETVTLDQVPLVLSENNPVELAATVVKGIIVLAYSNADGHVFVVGVGFDGNQLGAAVDLGTGSSAALANNGVAATITWTDANTSPANTSTIRFAELAATAAGVTQSGSTVIVDPQALKLGSSVTRGGPGWGVTFNASSPVEDRLQLYAIGASSGSTTRVSNEATCNCLPHGAWNGSSWGFVYTNTIVNGRGFDVGFIPVAADGAHQPPVIPLLYGANGFPSTDAHIVWTGSEYIASWSYFGDSGQRMVWARLDATGTPIYGPLEYYVPAGNSFVGSSPLAPIGPFSAHIFFDGVMNIILLTRDGSRYVNPPLQLSSGDVGTMAVVDANTVVVIWTQLAGTPLLGTLRYGP